MHWLSHAARAAAVSAVCLLAVACSTPDMKPFAEGAASLSTSVTKTNSKVETTFAGVADRDSSQKGNLIKFQEAARIFSEMAALAAGYSAAVADLAAAGETGAAAADQIVETVKGFTEFLQFGGPTVALPAELAGSAAGRAIQTAAKLWTRLQAQKRLLETMREADPAVQELAGALVEVYGQPIKAGQGTMYRSFEKIIRNLAFFEEAALKREIGGMKISFYEEATKFLEEKAYNEAFRALQDPSPNAAAAAAAAFADKKEILAQKARIEDEISAYRSKVSSVRDWQARQLRASYLIADTAKAWAAEHKRLLGWLESCGGTRFLQSECGQFSAASLKALAVELQFIIKGDS